MSARSAREDTALQNLAAWDGLARLDSILNQVRSRPNFFLTVPRILRVEGVHSDMLGWLLDPKGWHGLADRFAVPFGRAMLAACKRCGEGALVVEEVHREFSTGKGPIDILLHLRRGDERFVLGIENKIDAPEGKNQLRRYGEGLAYTFPGTAVVLTFLTPDGRKPQSTPGCPVASIGYRTIVALLEEALAAPPARGRHSVGLGLARHYCAALRSHIMPEQNPEIDELCRKLYNEHLDAWRAIRRRLPSKRDESHASVGSKVCQRLEEQYQGRWQFLVRRDKYACVFRSGWGALGVNESDPIVGLSQSAEPGNTYPKIHFRLAVDSADTDAGERVTYSVPLKVDMKENRTLGESVVQALRTVPAIQSKIPSKVQFTLALKSTSKLPAPGDEPATVPDSVVDWHAQCLADLVRVLDPVLPTT